MRTLDVGLSRSSLPPMSLNLNQSQAERLEIDPTMPENDVATAPSMDGIDGLTGADSDTEFPDSDDDEPMLIDLGSNPAGHSLPRTNDHQASQEGSAANQVITRFDNMVDPFRSGPSDTTGSELCSICSERPAQKDSDYPTCGKNCTLQYMKFQGVDDASAKTIVATGRDPGPSSRGDLPHAGPSRSTGLCAICNKSSTMEGSTYPTCGPNCTMKYKRLQGIPPDVFRGDMRNPYQSGISDASASQHPVSSYWAQVRNSYHPGTSYASVTQPYGSHSSNRVQMCQVCHVRPRYQRGSKTYPTCGLKCAAKLQNPGTVEMCDFCKKRPKVVLNGRTYPHCGRTCRDSARATGTRSNRGTCTTCLNCWKAFANPPNEDFCSPRCKGIVDDKSPILVEVPRGHVSFDKIEDHFKDSWKQTRNSLPSVKRIYMICLNPTWDEVFDNYGARFTTGMPGINRKKPQHKFRWLDMSRECKFGGPGNVKPCTSPQCALCSILRGSYEPQNFGGGILTTSLPNAVESASKSTRVQKTSKTVVLTKVHFSKVVDIPHFHFRELSAPNGVDAVSIVGIRQNGMRVDLDQILVFDNRAVRPIYLISFE